MSYKDSILKVPSDISNFDILLHKHEDGHVEMMSFNDTIGNRRFQIFLDIHRRSYNEALHKNDLEECERIIEKVVYTICHSCVPKGRFLEQDMTGWRDLGSGIQARERIRRGFLGLLFTLPIQTRSVSTWLPPQKKKKKEIHVNLADERFVVIENVAHTETRDADKYSDISSNGSDSFDGIVSDDIGCDLPNVDTYNLTCANTINNDKETGMSDSDLDTFDDIVSNEISYDIPAIL